MIDTKIIVNAADLCRGIYCYPGDAPVGWSYYDDGSDDGLRHGFIKIDGIWYLCNRGSVTAPDWFDDLEAVAVFDPILQCYVHPGFNRGTWRVWQKARTIIDGPWVACGHSLGATRADNEVAYAILDGRPPIARVVFGEPKPGFSDFAALVSQAPGISFRNIDDQGHDIVPDVPVRILVEKYQAPCPLTDGTASPSPRYPLDPFDYHHMPLYQTIAHALPIGVAI